MELTTCAAGTLPPANNAGSGVGSFAGYPQVKVVGLPGFSNAGSGVGLPNGKPHLSVVGDPGACMRMNK